MTITSWGALSNMLCNKSSINATFNSNHTFERLHGNPLNESIYDMPDDLRALLMLNRENTHFEAARRKILKVHFSDFNIQSFINMELKALPHAIAWMARDEYASSLLYRFVRDTSIFLNIGGVVTQSENGPTTKRQKT